jgi:hypothetical protein
MKKAFMALMLGTALWPADGFAQDPYYRDSYRSRDRFERRVARPGDPGFYCHRHPRTSYRDEPRRHCHSISNDPHGVVADRAYPRPWRR